MAKAHSVWSVCVLALFVLPSSVWCQTAFSGSIAGVARDTTGGVLPGVTVEASSPALIGKVRSAITDDQGQYKIVDLRPGTYTVTFTLSGFNTFRLEAIELTTGFTATANAEMRVGALDETIVVTGASPIVDTQNVRSQNVLTREVLDLLPAAKTFSGFAALTLGVRDDRGGTTLGRDVGGNKGEGFAALSIHGSAGGLTTYDGMRIGTMNTGTGRRIYVNEMGAQEVVLETSGASAETQSGGVNVNVVPKDGGNVFRWSLYGDFSGDSLQGSNLTDDLRSRGLTRSNSVGHIYDVSVGLGGPIKKDKLWFYTPHRWWGSKNNLAGVYFNKIPTTLFYEPDTSRPGYESFEQQDNSLRLTWQVSQKHKIVVSESRQDNCICYYNLASGTVSPEGTIHLNYRPNNLVFGAWTYPATSRLLFDAGLGHRYDYQDDTRTPETPGSARSVVELSTNMRYGSSFNRPGSLVDYGKPGGVHYDTRFGVSYVTGSHAFKTGFYSLSGRQIYDGHPIFPVQYTFRNRVPVGLTQMASPDHAESRIKLDLGMYAQDQWTLKKLTLNVGLRVEYFNGYNPAQVRPAGEFVPEFRFDPVYNVPNWTDLNPRLGAAYDLFGNGRTALKASWSRYSDVQVIQIAQASNPALAIVGLTTRTWNDTNGDYVPDCDLRSPLASGECGGMANSNFGKVIIGTRFDDDVREGFNVRPYSWQGSVSIQHQVTRGVGIEAGYFRTWRGGFTITDDLALTPADFDPFCVTAPVDSRLPNGGGYQLCGLYDIKPERFGVPADNLVMQTSEFGKRTQIFNGVDVGVNARFGAGGLLRGGISTGNAIEDNCVVVDSPQNLFCRTGNPHTEIKLSGNYPLVWGFQVSATVVSLPGRPIQASYVATNDEIAPSLGRNLGACGTRTPCTATVTLNLIEPNTLREDRDTQVDIRLSKILRIGRGRLLGSVDVYNLFNAATVLAQNTRFGSSWRVPTDVLAARLVKFGVRLDF